MILKYLPQSGVILCIDQDIHQGNKLLVIEMDFCWRAAWKSRKKNIRNLKFRKIMNIPRKQHWDNRIKTIEMVWTFEGNGNWQNSKNYTGVECWGQEEKGKAYGIEDGWSKKKHNHQRPHKRRCRVKWIVAGQNLFLKDIYCSVEKSSIKTYYILQNSE